MLSRTAGDLFWLGRNIERADNVSRLVEAGRRFETLAGSHGTLGNEWTAILIVAGCRDTFPGDIEKASGQEAIHHLLLAEQNHSSVWSCFNFARANARAQRGAISTDTWLAVNEAWSFAQNLSEVDCSSKRLIATLERIRGLTAQFRGAATSTLLMDERLRFLELGRHIERADATARLIDVKYHVFLPEGASVGSGFDQLHWHSMLHAAGARASYRWVYRQAVHYKLVIDFLVLNTSTPRSCRFALTAALLQLEALHRSGSAAQTSLEAARQLCSELETVDATGIIAQGLHEYSTLLIINCNALATQIARDFGFASAESLLENTQSQ